MTATDSSFIVGVTIAAGGATPMLLAERVVLGVMNALAASGLVTYIKKKGMG